MDVKDLRLFKASELKIGGYFYLKNYDGNFILCKIDKSELENKEYAHFLRLKTQEYSKANRLFVRISNPWMPFERL